MESRIIIQAGIEKGSTMAEMAARLKVPRSTVYREIKANSSVKKGKWRSFANNGSMPPCPLLRKFPFTCQRCDKAASRCTKDIVAYDAYEAEGKSRESLVTSRDGPKLGAKAMAELDAKVSPKIMDGQSLYNVVESDATIGVSQSTLRRYVGKRYLAARNIDLPRAVRFHAKREYDYGRKHVDAAVLDGRTFACFGRWREANPKAHYLEVDTVIGRMSDAASILTVYEPESRLQWGYLVPHNAASVNAALLKMIEAFGPKGPFKAILADNGPEFSSLPDLEPDADGVIRIRAFYCDPYRSGEKGGCESSHRLIRYMYKKGTSFAGLGQSDVGSLFSEMGSLRRKSLGGETPAAAFRRLFGDDALRATGIAAKDPKEIILRKKKNK